MGEAEVNETSKKLEETDLLRLQNSFLKLHALNTQAGSIKSQFEVLRRDAMRVDQEVEEAKKNLVAVRSGIAVKYRVDLTKMTVDKDGNFVPLDQKQMPFPTGQGPAPGGNGGE